MNNLVSQLLQSHFKGSIATILDSTDLEEQEIVFLQRVFSLAWFRITSKMEIIESR